jgi:hypothetical protein
LIRAFSSGCSLRTRSLSTSTRSGPSPSFSQPNASLAHWRPRAELFFRIHRPPWLSHRIDAVDRPHAPHRPAQPSPAQPSAHLKVALCTRQLLFLRSRQLGCRCARCYTSALRRSSAELHARHRDRRRSPCRRVGGDCATGCSPRCSWRGSAAQAVCQSVGGPMRWTLTTPAVRSAGHRRMAGLPMGGRVCDSNPRPATLIRSWSQDHRGRNLYSCCAHGQTSRASATRQHALAVRVACSCSEHG